jgi:DUF4097 and DUF4098 domain-containing protein YvlB
MKPTRVYAAMMLPLIPAFLLWAARPAGDVQDKGAARTFSVSKGGTLMVHIGRGDIRVAGWDRDEVSVRISGLDAEDLDNIEISQQGTTVSVRDKSRWGGLEMRVSVSVPSRFDTDLRTSGGDLELEGPLSGSLRGTTSGGNITLGNLGGDLKMSTSGGNIDAGSFQGDFLVNTSGGNITVRTISGQGDVTTSGGDIQIEKCGKGLRANTSGGDIRVGDIGGEVTVSTSGGDVEVGKATGNATLSTSGGNIVLHGANGKITATSAGGDLTLMGVTGSVRGNTAGGNIDATLIPGKNGRSRLNTAGGDIRLHVPDNARATILARIRLDTWGWHKDDEQYDIRSDFKIEDLQKDRHEIRGTVNLNGGGEEIVLETANGSIEIRKTR